MGVRCVSVFLEPVRIWVTFFSIRRSSVIRTGKMCRSLCGTCAYWQMGAARLWSLLSPIRSLEFQRISYLCRGVRTIAWVRRNRDEIMWRWPIVLIGLHETRMTFGEVGRLLGFLLNIHWRMPTSFFNAGPSLSPSGRIVSEGAYAKGIRLSGMMAYK